MATRRNSQLLQDIPLVLIVAFFCRLACGKVICVDDNAAGANDGSNWENAYVYLQDALADAKSAEKPVEIRAAKGIYRPNQGLVAIPEFDWRTTTFQLVSGVVLKGGYAGLGKPDPNARDVELYETTLSGDLNGDDLPVSDLRNLMSEPTRAENSYNVVTGSGTDNSAVLDGFTITGGNANGPYPKGPTSDRWRFVCGAGICNVSGSPTVANCTFAKNSGHEGGGMFNYDCSLSLSNCRFIGNSAHVGDGGGMENLLATLTLTDCALSENYAWDEGGGMINYKCSLTMTNCTFLGNSASFAGGGVCNKSTNLSLNDCTFMQNWGGNVGGGMCWGTGTLTNCVFIGNEAVSGGGLDSGGSTLINCAFIANKASDRGGGMYNSSVSAAAINCLFNGNSAEIGGGIYNLGLFTELNLTNCTLSGNSAQHGDALASHTVYGERFLGKLKLMNCILWGSSNEIWNNDGSAITISYSDIQGGLAGVYDPYGAVVWDQGNIDADPLFANPGRWVDANDPNIVVEPNDPNAAWVDGDYHLKSQAGRWDPNSQVWVMDDATSPCIDAGDPTSSVDDEPEPNGRIINMGAYGGTAEASKSP